MAKKDDPTIKSADSPEFPEGTHPAKSPGEVTHSPDRFGYEDNPDKPDPSTVAQVQVVPEDAA